MAERRRFPGYSTLAKRDTVSWNDATRRVIDKRLNHPPSRRFFSDDEWAILTVLCDRIIPQSGPDRVPIANFIDQKMAQDNTDGMQRAGEPDMQQMWRSGLAAIDAEAKLRFGQPFVELPGGRQDEVLRMVQHGDVRAAAWAAVRPASFFKSRVLHDVVTYFYGNPKGWDEIGFGGPASPRGYVRMGFNRYDPWDAVEYRSDSSDA